MPVTPGAIAVLLASTLIIAALAGVGVLTSALLWSVKQIQPLGQMRSKVSELEAMVQNLEAQVIHLRTKKAGRISAARKAEREAEPDDDPALEGLTPEEKALFM